MKPRTFGLVIAILVLLVATFLFVQSQNARLCKVGKITSTFDAPSEPGMAAFQTSRIDENCNLIIGPVQTVPIEELPGGVFDPYAQSGDFPTLTGGD